MENHTRHQVIGNTSAPFETSLSQQCATADDYRSVGSPSLPNYLAMTSGDIQGVHDDRSPARHVVTADNLFRQVRATHRAARTYSEAMPTPCAAASTSRYAVKHNPAVYYQGGDDRRACTSDDVPAGSLVDGAFITDLRARSLPALSVIIPDICNDTHDCPVATGDRWLRDWVGKITGSRLYAGGRTALFIVWDEPSPMPFFVVAPTVQPGAITHVAVDHYALLRTTEDLLGITQHLGHARGAPSLRQLVPGL
jgi:phospholipase C